MDKKVLTNKAWYRTDTFDIVELFPTGYVVWNIGRHNFAFNGYIPLAKPTDDPYHIDATTLKTIKVDTELADLIMEQAQTQTINYERYAEIAREWRKKKQYGKYRIIPMPSAPNQYSVIKQSYGFIH